MITQHLVEHLGIVRIAIDRVTKERVRDDIGDAKRPEQILAVSEHPLEHVSERGEARTERLDPRRIERQPVDEGAGRAARPRVGDVEGVGGEDRPAAAADLGRCRAQGALRVWGGG